MQYVRNISYQYPPPLYLLISEQKPYHYVIIPTTIIHIETEN